jgi:hypothetical protein
VLFVICLEKSSVSPALRILQHLRREFPGREAFAKPQKIATAFGGLATPPGTFRGTLDKKKLHLPVRLHISLKPSKSNISPMGIPQPASNHSCKHHIASPPLTGLLSKLGQSPATAANWFSHRNLRVASLDSTPAKAAVARAASAFCSFSLRALNAAVNPVRRKRMSPGRKTMFWSAMRRCRWESGMEVEEKGVREIEFCEAQDA